MKITKYSEFPRPALLTVWSTSKFPRPALLTVWIVSSKICFFTLWFLLEQIHLLYGAALTDNMLSLFDLLIFWAWQDEEIRMENARAHKRSGEKGVWLWFQTRRFCTKPASENDNCQKKCCPHQTSSLIVWFQNMRCQNIGRLINFDVRLIEFKCLNLLTNRHCSTRPYFGCSCHTSS